jgi:tRNA pseudouridine32 synthase/23S rRNA pseudouridine746 synthase
MAAVDGTRVGSRRDPRPSTVRLPERPPPGVLTIFDFFLRRFPRIPQAIWEERFASDRVWTKGIPIDAATPFQPLIEVHYRREVANEPPVREDFRIVWSDRDLMVVDKPPNLPVTPGGAWVRGCLLHLLFEATGNDCIAPLHRLDRLTSGLALLSLDASTRSHYSRLFQPGSEIKKTYTAVCEILGDPPLEQFSLADHITRSPTEYWRQIVRPGLEANASCEVRTITTEGRLALLEIRPDTGRKHQIRVQLAHHGLPILGDPLYGTSRSYRPGDISQRMWLDSHRLKVASFPRANHTGELTASWSSERTPDEFFLNASGRESED